MVVGGGCIHKTFKYRLYPTKEQISKLNETLWLCSVLYNQCLAERRDCWEFGGHSVTKYDQMSRLPELRKLDERFAKVYAQVLQDVVKRLDRTYGDFFRRVKNGEKAGYPRFKSARRYDSFTYPQMTKNLRFEGNKYNFPKIGEVKIKLHRPIEGKIKTVSFKREIDSWYVVFACELPDVEVVPSPLPPIGIDLGLKSFLVTSDGDSVDPPHFFRDAQAKLRRAQRHLSRCKKGSNRRKKAVKRVAKIHQHIANQRLDFHHKLSRDCVDSYGLIAHEDLNIKGITRTRLAKSVSDVGWASFLTKLQYKAEEAGVAVVKVDPRNTTQTCSQCGHIPDEKLTLSDRTYVCEKCGFTADRDYNAALNILRLGLSRQALTGTTVSVA